MFVKPAEGLKVRDPYTRQHLPDEGREVPETADWMQMLAVGDVVRAQPPATQADGKPAAERPAPEPAKPEIQLESKP